MYLPARTAMKCRPLPLCVADGLQTSVVGKVLGSGLHTGCTGSLVSTRVSAQLLLHRMIGYIMACMVLFKFIFLSIYSKRLPCCKTGAPSDVAIQGLGSFLPVGLHFPAHPIFLRV